MKKVKKLLVCMLTVIMMLTMAVPTQAAGVYKPQGASVRMTSSGRMYLSWRSQSVADGYRIRVKDFSTNKTSTYYANGTYNNNVYINKNANKAYRVAISAYRYKSNGKVVFGKEYVKYVCYERSISKTADYGSSIRVGWKKLSGISGYRVYKSRSQSSGYRQIATLSAKSTSCVIANYGAGTRTYFKIIPYKTVNGVKYNLPYNACSIYTYYY